MSFALADTSVDGFLGGRLHIRQPIVGYRAATDPVFLAASVDANPEQSVLDLGCGVGVASLCLGVRVAGVRLTGLEIQSDYAELAHRNAAQNDIAIDVVAGDLLDMPQAVKGQSFDHVITNPPFFDGHAVSAPLDAGKATAHVFESGMADWIDAGLKRLKPSGTITIIQLSEQLPDILASLIGRTGDIHVLPLASRRGRAAKRVLVKAKKGSRAPLKLLPPFHIHSGDAHVQGQADYSAVAAAILREGAPLSWE